MLASKVRAGMWVHGVRVRQVVLTYVPRTIKGHPAGTTAAYAVTLVTGRTAYYPVDAEVPAVGYAERLPAGRVAPKLANSATRVRVNSGRWRGESGRLGELRTHETDLIAKTNMYDAGRVNGVVGVPH